VRGSFKKACVASLFKTSLGFISVQGLYRNITFGINVAIEVLKAVKIALKNMIIRSQIQSNP